MATQNFCLVPPSLEKVRAILCSFLKNDLSKEEKEDRHLLMQFIENCLIPGPHFEIVVENPFCRAGLVKNKFLTAQQLVQLNDKVLQGNDEILQKDFLLHLARHINAPATLLIIIGGLTKTKTSENLREPTFLSILDNPYCDVEVISKIFLKEYRDSPAVSDKVREKINEKFNKLMYVQKTA